MSYRGTEGFTWSTDQARSTRVIAAIALIVAGWVFGFFSGRMSAWVFPVANPDLVAIKASLKPAHQPAVTPEVTRPQAEEKERPSLALSPAATQPEQSSLKAPETPDQARANAPPIASEKPEAIAKPSPRGAVLVNPEWTAPSVAETVPHRADPPSAETESPRAERNRATEAGMAECERRYSSFRASDGTYQPYDRNSRVLCPFLR